MSVLVTAANNLIDTLGAPGIGIGLAINAMGIPIPSEILLPLGGIGIKSGHYTALNVFVWAVVGQLVGLSISYAIARYGGVALVERYGRYVGIRRRELDHAQSYFDRYGGWLVLFGLCLPAIHGYVGYPAGIAKMNYARFMAAAAVGASIWAAVLLYLGYALGNNLDVIDRLFRQFALVIIALVIIGVIWYVRRMRRGHNTEDPSA